MIPRDSPAPPWLTKTDDDPKRLMNVAKRFRYSLAQKYDRFSITNF